MIDISFEELVEAAQKLRPEQKAALVQTLHLEVMDEDVSLTREQALAELEALRAAGAFNNVESMRGKYNRPDLNISDDELNAYLKEIGGEWEKELDNLIKPD